MEEGSLRDDIRELTDVMKEKKKERKFRMPLRGKLSKLKMKKGWITIITIKDNSVIDFEKQPIEDSTYTTKDGTIHTTKATDVFFYKAKPVVFQPLRSLNPSNPLSEDNETYGQKYVMAKMLADTIKAKKKVNGMFIILLVVGGLAAYWYFSGGSA